MTAGRAARRLPPDLRCLNAGCPDHGKLGAGNLYGRGWTDRGRRIRKIRCRTCGREFSERKGTLLYRTKLPPEKAAAILRRLAAGEGIRKIARETATHRATIDRFKRKDDGI